MIVFADLVHGVGTIAMVAALAGCAYLLAAIIVVCRAPAHNDAAPADRARPAVTILKPLHGAEPDLCQRLLSFCDQRYRGEVQIVCGFQDALDPAIATVQTVKALRPDQRLDLVVDARLHGSNRKVSNLLHCQERACHEILVLADSDIEVDQDYLARVVDALERPGTGAVTCLYEGTGHAAGAALSAQAINAHFLPNTLVGLALGAATPCCGSTIALHRDILARIGGFAAIADRLADDYALGEAVRRLGLAVAVPPFTVQHACGGATVGRFLSHQLRFARTIRSIDPLGHGDQPPALRARRLGLRNSLRRLVRRRLPCGPARAAVRDRSTLRHGASAAVARAVLRPRGRPCLRRELPRIERRMARPPLPLSARRHARPAETVARMTGREPFVSLDSLRMSKHLMFYSSSKAERELGYRARPYRHAIKDALDWFVARGYVPTIMTTRLSLQRKTS